MKVLLSCPTYGTIDPECASTLRYSIMVAARNGIHWVADLSPDRMTYSDARNMVCEWVKDNPGKVDGIMWVDSDIVLKTMSIYKLLATAKEFGYDILTGVYHQRLPPYEPVFFRYEPESNTFKRCKMYNMDEIIKVDGCGFGFCYTSEKVINAIHKSKLFNDEGGRWFPDKRQVKGGFGEDLGFCNQARLLGYPVYVDTGNQVEHMGNAQKVNRDTWVQYVSKGKELVNVEAVGMV